MRRAAKVDANQGEIVNALRSIGASVEPLHQIGGGCPDLLVGFRGVNFLLEVKDGSKPRSHRIITPAESAWHAAWAGQVAIVVNIDQALAAIGVTAHVES